MNKRILPILICILICFALFVSCDQVDSSSPIQYDDIYELAEKVGFKIVEPTYIPDGYALAGYFSMDKKIAEIVYADGEEKLIYAMTSIKKIESDFDEFDETKDIEIDGLKAEVNLIGGKAHLGILYGKVYNYAFYSKLGLEEAVMKQLLESIIIAN